MSPKRRPTTFERLFSRVWCRLVALGLAPSSWPGKTRTGPLALEVKGRRSGRQRSTVVTWVEVDGERYLVSMLGERSDWVANVRAAGGEAVLRRGRRQKVHLEELPVDRRPPVLQAWLQMTARIDRVPSRYLGLDRNAALEEFEGIAPEWPVFRILRATERAGDGLREGPAGEGARKEG